MAASAELTNEEVLARHRASFMEKIAELQERQGKGSKFLNMTEQEAQIQRLVTLEERRAKPTFEDMNLIKRRAVLNIESHGQVLFDVISHEFPNVLPVIVSSSDGMFKLATKDGYLNSFYARNQFETLPTKHLMISDVNTGETRALRTAANAQSTGGGQGFSKCGCNKACQNNSCKCMKNKVFCNSRCHGKAANPKCLNHD